MQKALKDELNKLKDKSHIEKSVLQEMLHRVDADPKLVKSENVKSHFCAFFVPVDKKTNSIYLGHHIKADDWIPPGGHMKKGEHPIDTVRREFNEELGLQLTSEEIELFDVSIKDVKNNPRNPCWTHYDFWYLVYTDKLPFVFDRGEFYDAYWHDFETAFNKIKIPKYNTIVKKIYKHLSGK